MKTTKEEALKQKESETQRQLSDWVRTCGLFDPGDQIQIAMTLVSLPAVVMLPNNHGKRVKRWENVTSDLSEEDWNVILGCQTTRWFKEMLGLIKEKGCKPFDGTEIVKQFGLKWFNSDSINTTFFAKHKLHYRIRHLGHNGSGAIGTYQIFKVRPLFRKK